jgi:hypothetical protein
LATTEGLKFDMGKPRVDLLPPDALLKISQVLDYGARKYGDRNWELGMEWQRLYAAVLRRLFQWQAGEDLDEESGLPHLAHAGAGIMFLLSYQHRESGTDNRPQALVELRARTGRPVLDLTPYEVSATSSGDSRVPVEHSR